MQHEIYVSDIVRLCHGKVLCGKEEDLLSTFSIDTRTIQSGDVYVGIEGQVVDGSSFYLEAIQKGAKVCILKEGFDYQFCDRCTIVVVPDTLKCLQELAKYKRSLYDIPVVAVTGSVGKTSTKDIIYQVLASKYHTHKTIGNYNNHIGVPLTILGLKDHEAMVVEMGMNHFGEISQLTSIAQPTISVITNIGTAHIGNLGSRENILKAKLEILDSMALHDVIINRDDDMLITVEEKLREKYQVHTVSILEESIYQAVHLKEDVFGSRFDILGKSWDIEVNVGGRAYIYNSLIAYAVGSILGIEDCFLKEGISKFKLTGSRLERKVTRKGTVLIDDTYNANYDSMKASIELLGRVLDKRKIAILGDMLELGDYTEEFHTKLGNIVVENQIDVLITIGEYSKWIALRAKSLGMKEEKIFSFDQEKDSYSFLETFLEENDIVLLKGSHGIHLIGIVDDLMNL